MSDQHLRDTLDAVPNVVFLYKRLQYAYRIGETDMIERYHERNSDLVWFETAKNRIQIEAEAYK